jgi:cell division protein FtsQ
MNGVASMESGKAGAAPMDVRLMNVAAVALMILAGLAALTASLRWIFAQPVFSVSRVVVDGDTAHHNDLTLKANVGGRISGNFFTLDLARAREVFESVAWVRGATVKREFPNRLRVTLQEHRSVAFWGIDSESRMVNSFGEVFEANAGDAETEELPRFVGAEGQSAAMLSVYKQMASRFDRLDLAIEQLELSVRGGWRVQLDSGTRIDMGRGSEKEVMARLEKFLSTYRQVLASYQRSSFEQVESVDLRNGEGYAIRLRGVSTLANAPVAKNEQQ